MTFDSAAIVLHGPRRPESALVLDSPHSGFEFPADFDAAVSEFELRDGEDCTCPPADPAFRCSLRAGRAPTSIPTGITATSIST